MSQRIINSLLCQKEKLKLKKTALQDSIAGKVQAVEDKIGRVDSALAALGYVPEVVPEQPAIPQIITSSGEDLTQAKEKDNADTEKTKGRKARPGENASVRNDEMSY